MTGACPSLSLAVPVLLRWMSLTTLHCPPLTRTSVSLPPPHTFLTKMLHLPHSLRTSVSGPPSSLLQPISSLLPAPLTVLTCHSQNIFKTNMSFHLYKTPCGLCCLRDKWISLMVLSSKYLSPVGRDVERHPNTNLALIILNQDFSRFGFFDNASDGHTGLAGGGRVQPHMITLESREGTLV